MANLFPDTDIEVGKWYPATQIPPDLFAGEDDNDFSMLLAIKSIGPIPGFYFNGSYYWHCERYDITDDADEAETDLQRQQEINECLQWREELARGVTAWMIIPTPDDDLDSIDNLSGYDPIPYKDSLTPEEKLDQVDTSKDDNLLGKGKVFRIDLN